MLRLYLAAVSAVVVANVVVAIAAIKRRGPSRFWWLSPRFLERSPDRESKMGFRDRYILAKTYMRRKFSFLFSSALLLAGLTVSAIEIVRGQDLQPFVLFNALILVAAGGVWLLDERHH